MSSRTPSDKEIPLDPSQEQAPTNSPAFVETQEDDDGFSTGSSVSVFDEDNELENGTRASSDVMSSSNGKDEPAIALKESRLVMLARWAAILILLGVTVAVGVGVYRYVSDQEQDDFKNSYSEQSQKVLDHVGNTFDQSLGALDNLMVSLTALHENEEDPNKDWPFVAFPNFALQAAKFMSLTGATSLHLAHRVTTGQRPQWEQFTVDNEGWIGEAWQFQEENGLNPPKNTSEVEKEDFAWQTVPYISDTSRSTVPYDLPGPFYPLYESSPITNLSSTFPYNIDLSRVFDGEFQALGEEGELSAKMWRTIGLDTSGLSPEEAEVRDSRYGYIARLDSAEREPVLMMTYPVVKGSSEVLTVPKDNSIKNPEVGALMTTFRWKEFLLNVLAPGSDGVVAVFGNDCGQALTFMMRGPDVEYLGEGDLHDSSYNDFERFSYIKDLGPFSLRDGSSKVYTGLPLSTKLCPYWIKTYASDELRDTYETGAPTFFTIVAIAIFVFTSAVFVIYDCASEQRQKKVLTVAVQSSNVVKSLFPKVVRDRLFAEQNANNGKPDAATKKKLENARLQLQSFLQSNAGETEQDDSSTSGNKSKRAGFANAGVHADAPIAELFTDTTVLFADLAGFTAWASARQPTEVFTLLETLYGAFDKLAHRRGVFKVETIGDSYVAVTGLPQPRANHAVIMAKFARDIRETTSELTRELAITLGPDTDDLELRIGMNSGPVTAGVLRGEKSRFQLFGDTVNTASRMESTGTPSKIQISQSTANLIRQHGKSHWITKREGGVEAKGKGRIQTYWIEPRGHSASSVGSNDEADDTDFQVMDDKTRRLVDWNVEIMSKLLKRIVVRREARKKILAGNSMLAESVQLKSVNTHTSFSSIDEDGTPLDEVKEVIELPEYDARLSAADAEDVSHVELDKTVALQLREYLSIIATMYRNNPFHCFEHASHVTMSVVKLMSRIISPSDMAIREAGNKAGEDTLASTLHDHTYGITSDPLTQFACLFSALIHDVDHQGIPNSQLIAEESPLVPLYKGKSIAEQNSVDLAWKLFMDDQFEDLRNIVASSANELTRFRSLVVNSVMATDIMDKDLKVLRNERWEKAFSEEALANDPEDVIKNRKATIVIEHLIQASDVAHTMQHWHIYRKWNEKLFFEMYQAYQAGRAEKNPADFWYKGEMGFFDFYIIPLAKKLKECGVFGVSSDEYLNYAQRNREEWENRGQELVESMLAKYREQHAHENDVIQGMDRVKNNSPEEEKDEL